MLRTRSPRKEKISNCYLHSNSLSNKMDNSLLAVRDINHKYIVVERGRQMRKKYYDDAKENAAFERCVDVVTALILKYGPAIKRKWILRDWIKNIQADCFWRSLACKRYQRYFDCMKAVVKNDAT